VPAIVVVGLVLVAGIARSATRSGVWKDNGTLFRHAVVDAPDSYRAHYMLGAWYFDQLDLRRGEQEYHEALKLFPYDPAVSYNMAEQYRLFDLCEPALPLYKWTRELDPDFPYGRFSYAACLLQTRHFADAKRMAYVALAAGADYRMTHALVVAADSGLRGQRADSAAAITAVGGRRVDSGKVPKVVQNARGN
jgi:tetratricopeptide (TPR) repeat protein